MNGRFFGGIFIILVGLILLFFSIWVNSILAFYGGIILLIGLFILFNSNEDKIEKINYQKIKK